MGGFNSTYQYVKHAFQPDHHKINARRFRNQGFRPKTDGEEPTSVSCSESDIGLVKPHQRRSAISCYTLARGSEEKEQQKTHSTHLTQREVVPEESRPQSSQAAESVDENLEYKDSVGKLYENQLKPGSERGQPSSSEHEHSADEVVGLYSYIARTEQELSFNEGDRLEILDGQGDWWKAKLLEPPYSVGYIPHTFVAKPDSLESKPWYFPRCSRVEAERYLMCSRNRHASFLVRGSQNEEGKRALSVRDYEKVRHYLIHGNETEGVFLSAKAKFPNIVELIEYHQTHRCRHLSKLGSPCIKLEVPQTVGLSYELTDKWEISRNKLELKQKLGHGNFGEVYEGLWNGVTKVAIKTLKPGGLQSEDFLKEAETMKKLIHPRVVQLYGVCTSEDPYYIVTELMSSGDLLTYLLKGKGRLLPVPKLIDIGSQIASGMAFLESKKFVHRDLAARNILVGEENICKVADFGLARITQDDMYITTKKNVKLPIKWTAPEALKFKEFTTKSDVWSFGIVLVEIIEKGMTPYPAMNNTEVYAQVNEGYRMPLSLMPNCPLKLYNIMLSCWEADPLDRPTFEALVGVLENFFTEADESTTNLNPEADFEPDI